MSGRASSTTTTASGAGSWPNTPASDSVSQGDSPPTGTMTPRLGSTPRIIISPMSQAAPEATVVVPTRNRGRLELRSSLHRGMFFQPSHERLLALAAGVGLARRTRGASLLLTVRYAALRHHGGWPGTLATLPAYAAVHLARVLMLVAASARHRTILL